MEKALRQKKRDEKSTQDNTNLKSCYIKGFITSIY